MCICRVSARRSPVAMRCARGIPERMEPIFREHMTSDRAQADLANAKQLARGARACLLCFEQDPMTCHRRFVAEMVSAETGQAIVHLHVRARG